MKNLKISIITPSLNQGKYLEETIDSIISQNYSNLEFLVIDGGSTDNSIDIIKKYQKYINFWVSEKDTGQSNAINKGFIQASGDIITWINSDDILQPNILPKISEYFEDPRVGLIFGKTITFGEGISEKISVPITSNLKSQFLGKVVFAQPSSFFRKDVLSNYGLLDESLHFGMDYDLFVRIALNYRIIQINELISRYRYHPDSKTISQSFNFALDWAKVFSKVLRSFNFTSTLISDLKSLNLYVDGSDSYVVENEYNIDDLNLAYLYFLQEQAQLYYGSFNTFKSAEIVRHIKFLDFNFYKKFKLDDIEFRSKYIPVSVLKLIKLIR